MQFATTTRLRIEVSGIVQGVGFRPFVYGLAVACKLSGFTRNRNGIVEIEVEGAQEQIDEFREKLVSKAPPLASISEIEETVMVPLKTTLDGFHIRDSLNLGAGARFIPPDAATCDQCISEIFDSTNRRFRYPFTNCTNCGPRFTIIKSLPYDRAVTTMQKFEMCAVCQIEYEDPADRRFHAQPNACHDCGPSLRWSDHSGKNYDREDAVSAALGQLAESKIVAVKGLGGYHLMADATSDSAISRLRQLKQRQAKPLALMMADLEMVRLHCKLSEIEANRLSAPDRPIVILERLESSTLPTQIAPGINRLGVMLPYTPLHHILLTDFRNPLIATSGNFSEEPIVIDNYDAHDRLGSIACGFLDHNREIFSRYDDSITQIISGEQTVLRRSRGIAPKPIKLPFRTTRTVLACGAHLKNTFCFIAGDNAYISQHIGNLDSLESHEHFEKSLETYMHLFDLSCDLIAHDKHPDYLSTAIAATLAASGNKPLISTQHHHAHIVSCMVENGITDRVIGVAFDGIGYGDDGTLWGGEFMLATIDKFYRRAHFEPMPMPGGNLAIQQPWRMALSYLLGTGLSEDNTFLAFKESLLRRKGKTAVAVVSQQIRQKLNSPLTSSCGRVFDAMSAFLNICMDADYEGQAAMELEALATKSQSLDSIIELISYPFEIVEDPILIIRVTPVFASAAQDIISGHSVALVAAKFHRTIAQIVIDVCSRIRNESRLNDVCLSGGVFQNKLLLGLLLKLLPEHEFNVHIQHLLPSNDGGLSLGQAAIALAQVNALIFEKGEKPCA